MHQLAIRLTYCAGTYKRINAKLYLHALLEQHISHLLRVRVLQELQLMADRLQTRPRSSKESFVLRRLTRAEFNAIKATGVVPYKNAVAILIVPPLNRNPKTKMRPKPSIVPTDEDPVEKPPLRPAPPLSTLHPTDGTNSDDCDNPSRAQVPLYHGITLFPNRSQRAALYASLSYLLFVEQARYRKHGQLSATNPPENSTD